MATFAVTGSAGGLGSAIRARIEAEGHGVVGVDVAGAEVTADLSDPLGRASAWAGVADACRGDLAGVVACAGLGGTVKPPSLVARVNYFGPPPPSCA
jgi:3alpha-hydroxysteroid 3-dehydrogenase